MVPLKTCPILGALALAGLLQACSAVDEAPSEISPSIAVSTDYVIGPGDMLQVFVWRSQELSANVRVRPDGRISVPLVEDLEVAGKTPKAVGQELQQRLSDYVKEPVVTVIMTDFVGPLERQVRVVGEAAKPQSLAYRNGMSVLDVLIQAGGLTQYAAGNRATLIRSAEGKSVSYSVRLDDLMKDGDVSANVPVAPGDILIIPQSYF